MSKARQDATLKKIEKEIWKHLQQVESSRVAATGYEDEMGEDIRDLEGSDHEE
jgi:hypothetical protein